MLRSRQNRARAITISILGDRVITARLLETINRRLGSDSVSNEICLGRLFCAGALVLEKNSLELGGFVTSFFKVLIPTRCPKLLWQTCFPFEYCSFVRRYSRLSRLQRTNVRLKDLATLHSRLKHPETFLRFPVLKSQHSEADSAKLNCFYFVQISQRIISWCSLEQVLSVTAIQKSCADSYD